MALKRRTPLRAFKSLESRTSLKRSPMKRKPPKNPMPPEVRAAVLARDKSMCQARVRGFPHRCGGRLHVHHVRLRSQKHGHDPADLLTLCAVAHDLAHNSMRAMAEEYGLIRRS